MINKIGELYQDKLLDKEDELRDKAIEKFNEEIAKAKRFELDSKTNTLIDTEENLDLSEYSTLGDFFEEYIGDTTHQNAGVYLTYYDEYSTIVSDHLSEVMVELIEELLEEDDEDFIKFIKELGYDIDKINIEELAHDLESNLPNDVVPMISEILDDLSDIKIEETI